MCLNQINIKHQQLYEGDLCSKYRFTMNPAKILSKAKISTDWLYFMIPTLDDQGIEGLPMVNNTSCTKF